MNKQTNKEIAKELSTGWWWGSLMGLRSENFKEVQKEYKSLTGKSITRLGIIEDEFREKV